MSIQYMASFINQFIENYSIITLHGTKEIYVENFKSIISLTETEVIMPINLPVGDVRQLVNLVDNKDNLGKEILLYGTITKYITRRRKRC